MGAPGPLSSIFAAVNPQITFNLASAGLVPTFGSGGVDRKFESLPPRVVWVPSDEDIGSPVGQGGDAVVDGQGNQNLPAGTPPILTRSVTVECDVWGADREIVDGTMIDAVYSAVHDTLSRGSYGVLRARWLLPEETLKTGEVYRIWFQFMVPVKRIAPLETTAIIKSLPLTPHVNPLVGS